VFVYDLFNDAVSSKDKTVSWWGVGLIMTWKSCDLTLFLL